MDGCERINDEALLKLTKPRQGNREKINDEALKLIKPKSGSPLSKQPIDNNQILPVFIKGLYDP